MIPTDSQVNSEVLVFIILNGGLLMQISSYMLYICSES